MGDKLSPTECWQCAVHTAVVRFADTRYAALARKAIYRLQRVEASQIYGEDHKHKTLWDEYCHNVQYGPYELLEDAWELTKGPIFDAIFDAIPADEAVLLTVGAIWNLNEDVVGFDNGTFVSFDLMRRNLEKVVNEYAGARDVTRFDPTTN